MSDIKINETPVRTSRNFLINNIKIENFEMPEIGDFDAVEIICGSNNIVKDNVDLAEKTPLVYGLGKILEEQVINDANKNIYIDVRSTENEKIYINYKFDKDNLNLIDYIVINAEENANATVYIKYEESDKRIQGYHNGIINVRANKNSNINIVALNFMNETSYNFLSIQNELVENAKVNYNIVDFGGRYSITNYYSNILGKEADNKLNTIYLGRNNQVFDLNYIAELRGEKSNIDIEVQGALNEKAKKNFKGTIDFKKGCKKATGNENEACMLLSDKARSIALPMLLCSEEDVEGNHSSSAGKIGDKELFYIMSRGFELKDALKLMVRAKFNKIIENIVDEKIKEEVLDFIDSRLD